MSKQLSQPLNPALKPGIPASISVSSADRVSPGSGTGSVRGTSVSPLHRDRVSDAQTYIPAALRGQVRGKGASPLPSDMSTTSSVYLEMLHLQQPAPSDELKVKPYRTDTGHLSPAARDLVASALRTRTPSPLLEVQQTGLIPLPAHFRFSGQTSPVNAVSGSDGSAACRGARMRLPPPLLRALRYGRCVT